jgi:hypothetical protein
MRRDQDLALVGYCEWLVVRDEPSQADAAAFHPKF